MASEGICSKPGVASAGIEPGSGSGRYPGPPSRWPPFRVTEHRLGAGLVGDVLLAVAVTIGGGLDEGRTNGRYDGGAGSGRFAVGERGMKF